MKRKLNKDGKLNSQQWYVYNYLKENGKVMARELVEKCGYYYDEDALNRNLSRISILLYKDVEFINNSPEIEKMIIWEVENNVLYYWLATNFEEVKAFVDRLYFKPALTKLKKGWNLLKKAEKDGQGKLLSAKGDIIDENSKAREYVEAFKKQIIE